MVVEAREFLSSLLHNKVIIFNIAVIAGVLIFLVIANIQQEIDLEEYATVPYDHTPQLIELNEYEGNVDIAYDKDTFQIDYRIGSFILKGVAVTEIKEDRPLPMSPAGSMFSIPREGNLTLTIAVKKITEDPAVYMLNVNDNLVAYFSDPFPTGYNSIVLYTMLEKKDTVKIEISKVKTLD